MRTTAVIWCDVLNALLLVYLRSWFTLVRARIHVIPFVAEWSDLSTLTESDLAWELRLRQSDDQSLTEALI